MAEADNISEKTFRWKYKTESAAKHARKQKDRVRQLSRINIGDQAERWKDVKTELGVQTNEAFAKLLLDRQVYRFNLTSVQHTKGLKLKSQTTFNWKYKCFIVDSFRTILAYFTQQINVTTQNCSCSHIALSWTSPFLKALLLLYVN